MKYPSIRLVFDRKKTATDEKPAIVQVEVKLNNKKKYISTGVKLYPDQWKKNQVVNRVDAYELMNQINRSIKSIRSWIDKEQEAGEEFSFSKLDSFIEYSNNSSGSFIDFIEKRIEIRTIKQSTKRQHRVLVSTLNDFGKIQSFADVTVKNIKLFDDYLKCNGNSQPTVHGYHKRLKVYIKEAIKLELLKSSPYDNFSVPKGEGKTRRYLDADELKRVEEADMFDDSIMRARDCFIFCCYTGLAYSDLASFNWEKDVKVRDGKFFIEDERIKTETLYKIQILPPAMRILQKYNYKLLVTTNQNYNRDLKVVAKYAKLNKPISSHTARHTFAVFALNNGVRIEVVSKMLAHRNIKTTQIYAKILQSEVEAGFDILEKKINQIGK